MNNFRPDQITRKQPGPKTKLIFIRAKPEERILLLRRLRQRKKQVITKQDDIIKLLGFKNRKPHERKRSLKILLAAERIGKVLITENLYSQFPSDIRRGLTFPHFVWNRYIHMLVGLNPHNCEKFFSTLTIRALEYTLR
jgi:hypothetical protein